MLKTNLNPSPIEETGGNYFRGAKKGSFGGSLHRGGLWKFHLNIRPREDFVLTECFLIEPLQKRGPGKKPVLSKTNLRDLHIEKASGNPFII